MEEGKGVPKGLNINVITELIKHETCTNIPGDVHRSGCYDKQRKADTVIPDGHDMCSNVHSCHVCAIQDIQPQYIIEIAYKAGKITKGERLILELDLASN